MELDDEFKARFLSAIQHHVDGLRAKVDTDFSVEAVEKELADLSGDPVYASFGLASYEYVLIRLIGRMSISVGRRLGEIYDKIPRFVAAARFGLTPAQVAEKFGGLELDIGLRLGSLQPADETHVQEILAKLGHTDMAGLGIEIRYNFNPNDSSRLRKDCDMADKLVEAGLAPVYLIFSSISPRDEAIRRLTRAGWTFFQGADALEFTEKLFGVNLMAVLEDPEVAAKIQLEIKNILGSMYRSDVVRKVYEGNLSA